MRYSERGPTPPEAEPSSPSVEESLYFFPDEKVSESRVRSILERGTDDERAWVISHLLRFAQWDDIWTYVTREEVREVFPRLELPDNLQTAWARMLKIEAPVA
ncbi:MAG: hypothetical protein GY719_07710 [bacterium]|nr:hypothetical protein [bacterium]